MSPPKKITEKSYDFMRIPDLCLLWQAWQLIPNAKKKQTNAYISICIHTRHICHTAHKKTSRKALQPNKTNVLSEAL